MRCLSPGPSTDSSEEDLSLCAHGGSATVLEESRKEAAPTPPPASGPELAAMMKIGTRVMRGVDWKWGDQVPWVHRAVPSVPRGVQRVTRCVVCPGRPGSGSGPGHRGAGRGRMDPGPVGHQQHQLLPHGQGGQIRPEAGGAAAGRPATHRGLRHGGRHGWVVVVVFVVVVVQLNPNKRR